MKKRSFVFTLAIGLLVLFTLFSSIFTILPHQETCEHATCECCVELETMQHNLSALLQEHETCEEKACNTCVFIKEQLIILQEKQETGHVCHEKACDFCVREAIGRRLRMTACALAVFAVVYAIFYTAHYVVSDGKWKIQAFSLFSLKVRLNN